MTPARQQFRRQPHAHWAAAYDDNLIVIRHAGIIPVTGPVLVSNARAWANTLRKLALSH